MSSTSTNENIKLPSDLTMKHATKLAIVEDRPIMLDYWIPSLEKKALIGGKKDGTKLLVLSSEEYTSEIKKFYKVGEEYIVLTENSIYIVSANIPSKTISS